MSSTTIIKCKCLGCSLHFAAYSFNEDWMPTNCPECDNKGPFMVWKEVSDEFIFQHVPGNAPLVAMGV